MTRGAAAVSGMGRQEREAQPQGLYLTDLCMNQKARADAVIRAKGGRTKH